VENSREKAQKTQNKNPHPGPLLQGEGESFCVFCAFSRLFAAGSSMMATAAVAAGTFLQILLGGNAAQFERLADEFLHFLLQFVQFLLGVDEPFGHRIAQEGLAFVIEGGHFAAIQGEALVLALVEGLALLAQALVLPPRVGVSHKRFDAPADALELRLLDDSLAQLQSFLAHRIFSQGICMHKLP
jgi:hypothetical protein